MTISFKNILYVDVLFKHDVISCAQQVESLESQLATRMQQLQTTIQSKTAVPTAQVYVSLFLSISISDFYFFFGTCAMGVHLGGQGAFAPMHVLHILPK